jgi:hypothetical protein
MDEAGKLIALLQAQGHPVWLTDSSPRKPSPEVGGRLAVRLPPRYRDFLVSCGRQRSRVPGSAALSSRPDHFLVHSPM